MSSENTFLSRLNAVAADTEALLERLMESAPLEGERDRPARLLAAVRYASLGGGKRFRPFLVVESAALFGVDRAQALMTGAALECVHCYSLVHDDLPAMDNDDLRRGRPTAHKAFDDATAILAGDSLLTYAFDILSRPETHASADVRVKLVMALARASGLGGMVGGQAIDLVAAGRVTGATAPPFDGEALEEMHARKTGALIRAAATLGAIAIGADNGTIRAIDDYARDLGLAFQIVDDVLDVEGSAAALGKTAGKDAAAGKPTYPALFGVDASRRMATVCVARAETTLLDAGIGGRLGQLARWSLSRRR